MIVNENNYYSAEAQREFMGSTQFKNFAGTLGKEGCEYRAVKILEEGEGLKSEEMMVSSVLDRLWEGKTVSDCEAEFPELWTKGKPKTKVRVALDMFEITKDDKVFKAFMSGEHQGLYIGEIDGVKFKVKPDSLLPDKIVDLKYMASTSVKKQWSEKTHSYMEWVRFAGYDIQGAIYQEIIRQATGKKLPFYLAVAIKGTEDKNGERFILEIPQSVLDAALSYVRECLPRITGIKAGKIQPKRCGKCEKCIGDLKEAPIISYESLEGFDAYEKAKENKGNDDETDYSDLDAFLNTI